MDTNSKSRYTKSRYFYVEYFVFCAQLTLVFGKVNKHHWNKIYFLIYHLNKILDIRVSNTFENT